uniref:Uncharacterized protein n=1 Tax=Arundo donax TaxID=35708 RepID=A0A0A9BL16_ARUDO
MLLFEGIAAVLRSL